MDVKSVAVRSALMFLAARSAQMALSKTVKDVLYASVEVSRDFHLVPLCCLKIPSERRYVQNFPLQRQFYSSFNDT